MEDLERAEFKVHNPCAAWLNGKDFVPQLTPDSPSAHVGLSQSHLTLQLVLSVDLDHHFNNPGSLFLTCLDHVRERSGSPYERRTSLVVHPQQQHHLDSCGQQLPGEFRQRGF